MHRLLFLPLLVMPVFLYAQKTKKITNRKMEETYSVLKSDHTTKQGLYTKMFRGYKMAEGNYENGQRAGEWKFYGFDGEVAQVYDYGKKKLIYTSTVTDTVKHKILQGNDTILTTLDSKAELLGGEMLMMKILQENIVYPQKAKEQGIDGKSYITFTINETGHAENHRILRGIGSGCDEEALRVVKLLPETWIPAKKDGKFVTMVFVIPIAYKLL